MAAPFFLYIRTVRIYKKKGAGSRDYGLPYYHIGFWRKLLFSEWRTTTIQ